MKTLAAFLILLSAALPAPAAEATQKLVLGIYSDAMPFIDHATLRLQNRMVQGRINDKDGSTMEAALETMTGETILSVKLKATIVEGHKYRFAGTYEAREPFQLEFLGSAEEDKDHRVVSFKAGKGKIDETVSIPFTYNRPTR